MSPGQAKEARAREEFDCLLQATGCFVEDLEQAGLRAGRGVVLRNSPLSEAGGNVEVGYYVDLRDKLTRKVCWEHLDEECANDPNQLDRDVVAARARR